MAGPQRCKILITGASSGLGAGMARLFAARGRSLALCARREDRLDEVAGRLRREYPGTVIVTRRLDVNDHDAVFRVFAECDRELGGLDRVIANAGIGKGQPIGTGYFERANRQTAETNVIGLLAQCEAAMELFRRRNAGHLVIMSSALSVRGAAGNLTTYAATKAAASSLAEGIRFSVWDTPIAVTCLQPGYIESEMTARAVTTPLMIDAQRGHRLLVKAIEREPANAYVPSWPWSVLARILAFAPAVLARRTA